MLQTKTMGIMSLTFTSDGKTCNVNFLTAGHEKEINHSADLIDETISARAAAHGAEPHLIFLARGRIGGAQAAADKDHVVLNRN